jgi:serine/threonine-protein kinase
MIGRLVDGRYQVRSRIARGGMATVYLATDLRLERRVAIKVMHGHLADDSKFRERFIQEARSAARLAHPNVVNVFDQGQDTDMAYLVMEYLPGITLRDLLTERHVLTTEQAFDILEAVLAGLAAAHKAGIVHRDLKPENVLLADDGRIKIGDFGLARAASANTATGAALLGTIAYLSPELVTRGIADARSDIYAVGIMMYEMLAGEQPFKGEQPMQIAYQHANDSVPIPSTKNPRVPAEFDELVLWATAREPDDRPRDARAMLDQLLETRAELKTAQPTGPTTTQRTTVMPSGFGGSEDETQVLGSRPLTSTTTVDDATTSLATRADHRRRRGWWLLAAVIVVAGLAGGTGWYFGTGPGSLVTIPDSIVGESVEAASHQLNELGLVVDEKTTLVYDPVVATGFVAGTNPDVGTGVEREATIVLKVSQGPKSVDVPEIIGIGEATAKVNIEAAGLKYNEGLSSTQFSETVAAGIVISAFGKDESDATIPLENGTPYLDQRPVGLVVSLGQLPPIAGKTLDEAKAALEEVGVFGIEGSHTFDDTIPEGAVIRAESQDADSPIRPNDTVLIVISKGVDLVEIPDIIGKSINEAAQRLRDAGFAVKVDSDLPDDYWGVQTVDSFAPGEVGGSLKRGTEITIRARVSDD